MWVASLLQGTSCTSCPSHMLGGYLQLLFQNFRYVWQLVTNSWIWLYRPHWYMPCFVLWKHFDTQSLPAWSSLGRSWLWLVKMIPWRKPIFYGHFLMGIPTCLYLQWHFMDLSWPFSLHSVCLSKHKSSTCSVVSERSWILLAVVWSLLVRSGTYSMGSLILSPTGPNLDKQSATWLVDPLMYLIQSYMVRSSSNSTAVLVWLVSDPLQEYFQQILTFTKQKTWNFSMAQATASASSWIAKYGFWCGLGTFIGKLNWVTSCTRTAPRPFKLASVQCERLAEVIISEYGYTGYLLFDSFKCLSMLWVSYKWCIFLDELSQDTTKFCKS